MSPVRSIAAIATAVTTVIAAVAASTLAIAAATYGSPFLLGLQNAIQMESRKLW